MARNVRDFLFGLTILAIAYVIYAHTVGAVIEPTSAAAHEVPKLRETAPAFARKHPYEHLFAEGAWELRDPKVLETDQGTLIFRDYKPLEGGKLEITPCTLVLYQRQEENARTDSGRAVVVQAPQGSVLQFDQHVDLTRGEFGKLVGGKINGEIRIFSPESAPGAADGLEMITRNVQIERLRAWTPHEVAFRLGRNRGKGRDLILELSASERASGKSRGPEVGGLQSIQLTQVDELELYGAGNSPFIEEQGSSATAATVNDEIPTRITCDGPLRYETAKNLVSLEDNVQATRANAMADPDSLRCDRLFVFLASSSNDTNRTAAEKKSLTGSVERLVAIGSPAVMNVPSQPAYAEADRIEYNLITRRLHMKNESPQTGIILRRGTDEFTAPELAYESVPGRKLGKLWAPGPGRLSAALSEQGAARTLRAQWTKEIRIRPHEANQVISLSEDAYAAVEGQGEFRAAEIHFWLLETANPQAGGTNIAPDRLLATGGVTAQSPQLEAEVSRLEAFFQNVPAEIGAPRVQRGETAPGGLELRSAEGAAPVNRPAAEPSIHEPLREPVAREEARVSRFRAVGETLRMQIITRGRAAEVREIALEGKTARIRELNAAEGDEPLDLEGSRIDLEGGTGSGAIVTLSGTPALASARGMKLRSTQMKLNRRENRLTIDRAGEMTLPMNGDLQGRTYAEPKSMKLAWSGSMIFDGAAARFRQTVSLNGDGFAATCDQLEAILAAPIDFNTSKGHPQQGDRPSAEIRSVLLSGRVDLTNRTFGEDGTEQSRDRLAVRVLSIDRKSGDLRGQGPGFLTTTREGATEGIPTATPFESPIRIDDERLAARNRTGLNYLRVDFREEMAGNLNERRVEFLEQVQAVYGPVPHWEAVLDPASRSSLGPKGVLLTADRLAVADAALNSRAAAAPEMEATGNTRVEGSEFTARAERLTFIHAKNQLILEGDGRNDAEIRHFQKNNFTSARRIVFQRDTNSIQVDDARVLNIGPVGNSPSVVRPPSVRDFKRN